MTLNTSDSFCRDSSLEGSESISLRRDNGSVGRSLALYGYKVLSISRQLQVGIDRIDSRDSPKIVTGRRYHINGNATSVHILTGKRPSSSFSSPPLSVLIIFVKASALPSFCETFS